MALAVVAPFAWRALHPSAPADAAATTAPTPAAVLVRPLDWAPRVALLAGDGRVGWQDGAAAQARFADPYGVAIGPDGTVVVADAGDNDRLRAIHPDGSVSTIAGGREGFRDGPAMTAEFNTPSGIAVDARGNVFIADTGNHAIRKLGADGQVTTLAGTGHPGWRDGPGAQAQFDGPLAVAVDAAGRVLVADSYNHRIRAIAPDGTVTTLAGGAMPGDADGAGAAARFDTPSAIVVDATGRIVVADLRNNALRTLDAAGNVATLVRVAPDDHHSLLRRPIALAVARDGTLAVGTMQGGVLRVSTTGELRTLVGEVDGGGFGFARPAGLAIGAGERLVVADAASSRVHVLTPRADAVGTPRLDGPIGSAPDRALLATASRWPLRPQLAWHEVVGVIGEDRGDGQGESRDHFHGGLDVRGDVGQEVVAIADAKVSSPSATFAFDKLNEGLALGTLDYIHMHVGRDARGAPLDPSRFILQRDDAGKLASVRVRRGTRFAAGDTLGSINPMAHVHLAMDGGASGNPLAFGFKDFRDHVPPTIASIEIRDAAGRRLAKRADGRLLVPRADLQLVVDAWDQVDDNLPRRRLGVYSLGYQWLRADGTPLAGFEAPHESVRFDALPDDADIKKAYADDSGISVQGRAETHFRYLVSSAARSGAVAFGPWATSAIAPGDYTLRIVAKDWSGNEATRGRDVDVRVVDAAEVVQDAAPAPRAKASAPHGAARREAPAGKHAARAAKTH